MKFQVEKFVSTLQGQVADVFPRLDRMFARIGDVSPFIQLEVREFVDASSGAVSRYLPDGNVQPDKDYHYIKTDNSANAVTIYPFGSQLVVATTSLTLTNQGDSAHLAFDRASQTWWLM